MSYVTIEDAVATVIRKVKGYSLANVSVGDNRRIAEGVEQAVILRRGGPSTRRLLTLGDCWETRWVVNVELYIPVSDEIGTIRRTIDTEMQKLLDEFDKWPFLDGTSGVNNAEAISVAEAEEYILGSRWWRQVITLQVDELTEAVRAE